MVPVVNLSGLPGTISSQLDQKLKDSLAAVPSGQKGHVDFTVSRDQAGKGGVQVGAGYRPTEHFDLSGWLGKEWGGGWATGARGSFSW